MNLAQTLIVRVGQGLSGYAAVTFKHNLVFSS